jgi:2-polyprenyl-6-methoxyphenol hydroxylase-like FAD-dependent oxidoreductase
MDTVTLAYRQGCVVSEMGSASQHVVVVGAGMSGLFAAMLLARDGHRVTVLERDPAAPPAPDMAWEDWERRGCGQFRLPHYTQPKFRHLLESELPDVAKALLGAGGVRFDILAQLPEAVSGGRRAEDDRLVTLTARRPVLEAVVARAAAAEPGVEIRRGIAVRELVIGRPDLTGAPHIVGVVTGSGEVLRAELVVDAGGRRSALPRLLAAIGVTGVVEEREDCGFVYYARHFRSADGLPPLRGPIHQQYDSVSLITLPADAGTWSVVITTSSRDTELRALRDPERWTAAARSFPLAAHWTDAEPITGVGAFAGIEDRIRRFVVHGRPVVTGALALGDAWACTNPQLGRGVSMGLWHAVLLREMLRTGGGEPPGEQALRWAKVTGQALEPWYESTLATSRKRHAEIEGDLVGVPYAPDDPGWMLSKALAAGAGRDPEVLRGLLEIASMLTLPSEVLGRQGMAERVMAAGAGAPQYPLPGPDRRALLAVVTGAVAA